MRALIGRLVTRLYGKPLLTNVDRGPLVEEIVAGALATDWVLCASDYASCDLLHRSNGLRIQVKQAAAMQSWGPSAGEARYSIATKAGRWENGNQWIAEPYRNAESFIFGWHPRTDALADHRDAHQWRFFVVLETDLPSQKSIGQAALEKLSRSLGVDDLANAVAAMEAEAILKP